MALQKNTVGKWIVFAFNRTDNTAKTGDAANITANVRIDGGAANAVDDTNPTELEGGYYVFDITAAEANGDLVLITPVSTTTDIQVIGVPGAVYTDAPNYNSTIAQTGDSFIRIGSPAGVSIAADIADTPTTSELNARTLLAAEYFDPAADTVANVTTVATCTTNTDMRGTDSAALAASFEFTVAGFVDSNVQRVNDVNVNGDGSAIPWGP